MPLYRKHAYLSINSDSCAVLNCVVMQNRECALGHSYTVQTPISKFKALHLSLKYRKVREVRKIIVLSVLKNRYCTVQLRSEAVFLFLQLTAINPLMHTLYVCPFLSVIVFSLQDTRPPPLSFFKKRSVHLFPF